MRYVGTASMHKHVASTLLYTSFGCRYWSTELEIRISFQNSIVWLYMELRFRIRDPILWNWTITKNSFSQYKISPLCIAWNWYTQFQTPIQWHPNNIIEIASHFNNVVDLVLNTIQFHAFQYRHPNEALVIWAFYRLRTSLIILPSSLSLTKCQVCEQLATSDHPVFLFFYIYFSSTLL
jgi:hypothetical protein